MAQELTEVYSPLWAPHVKGRYSAVELDPEGKREPQRVVARCEVCGAEYRNVCMQGMPRQHISRFAQVHSHKSFAGKKT
jgi:hypothetical protein